jgi:hypothetical protein
MKRTIALSLSIAIALACSESSPRRNERVAAAGGLTQRYARSALARWEVRGRAAGADCRVLLVVTAIVMDDSMVEALHYGAGAYDVYPGGLQQFSRDRAFRGVVYRDRSDRVWLYDDVTPAEAAALVPCR